MAKEKRASWFKLFLHQKPMMDAVEDAVLGRAMKAAMAYFDTGELVQLDPLANIVFASIRPFVDEATEDYMKNVENGKKGGRRKESQPETEKVTVPMPKELFAGFVSCEEDELSV